MSQAISAVIITFNEEENIGKCLRSIQQVVDEIIVIDSFSTDSTAQICEQFEVRFIQREWTNYSDQKNYGNQQASHDLILSMDADEELSPELTKSIYAVKTELVAQAYSMNRKSRYAGRWILHSGWYPDQKVRLFRKDVATWGGPIPHEQLKLSAGTKTHHLQGDLLHYPFASVDEHRKKSRHYADLAANNLQPKSMTYLFLKLLFSPIHRFVKTYFFQLGFLDGIAGFRICKITATEVFLKYKWALERKH